MTRMQEDPGIPAALDSVERSMGRRSRNHPRRLDRRARGRKGHITDFSLVGFGNPALGGNCPNNGGKQIFLGKIDPNDLTPNDRKQVDLVATVNPPIGGVDVYFKVWDVDDPFDQIHGPSGADDVPNVDLIDNNQAGPDNRPTPETPQTFTAVTNESGEASVIITVSREEKARRNSVRKNSSIL